MQHDAAPVQPKDRMAILQVSQAYDWSAVRDMYVSQQRGCRGLASSLALVADRICLQWSSEWPSQDCRQAIMYMPKHVEL